MWGRRGRREDANDEDEWHAEDHTINEDEWDEEDHKGDDQDDEDDEDEGGGAARTRTLWRGRRGAAASPAQGNVFGIAPLRLRSATRARGNVFLRGPSALMDLPVRPEEIQSRAAALRSVACRGGDERARLLARHANVGVEVVSWGKVDHGGDESGDQQSGRASTVAPPEHAGTQHGTARE